MLAPPIVPPVADFIAPTLSVVREAGGPIDNKTIDTRVFAAMALPADVLVVPHDARSTEAEYRSYWARTYLGLGGLLLSPSRATWVLAPDAPPSVEGRALMQKVRLSYRAAAERRAPLEKAANDPEISEEAAEEIRRCHADLLAKRIVRPAEELQGYYEHFRERFGPRVLASLNGPLLLEKMHERGTKDSLVYWLEFKDDEELPDLFGGIGGGSALKFGIYKAKETGQWMTGSPASMKVLSPAEAIEAAQRQREHILAAARILEEAARDPGAVDYTDLQTRLEAASDGLCNIGWVHKYLAMLFPTVLDDFHAVSYQSFNLIKLGKLPAGGLYSNARCFVAIAKQAGIPTTSLGTTLNKIHGGTPHAYWRVGTTVGAGGATEWPRMRDGGFVSVGWEKIPFLRGFDASKDRKLELAALMQQHYPNTPQAIGKVVNGVHGSDQREVRRHAKHVSREW